MVAYDIPVRVDPVDVGIDFVLEQFGPAAADLTQRWFGAKNVAAETPPEGLTGRLPFATAVSLGGESDRFQSGAVIDLSVFDTSYARARTKAFAIEARLLGYPFRVSSGGRSVLVDSVEINVPMVEVPWLSDSTIRRFQGTYRLSIRR